MKMKTIVCLGLAAGLLAGCESEKGEHAGRHHHKEAKLMAEAKISKEAAEKTALARVPDGTIKDSELEKENGKLQWSFDMATPGTSDVTEVNVDAITGDIVNVESEVPEKDRD